ncbi:DUF6494 family protein [Candidatus Gracilibacteria bacterium]|jgi:hypothetical protein|nr:DUF6494 family protein [Candidatus Gracilibacteria bacterium]|tara:strand:- start:918 stop:1115 length:198 start_codon:yes stop_codon:yes gene_type:complete
MLHEVDEQENRELRKFLKRVGVNSQRIIESYSGPKDDITISLNIPQTEGQNAQLHIFRYGDKNET